MSDYTSYRGSKMSSKLRPKERERESDSVYVFVTSRVVRVPLRFVADV